MELFVDEKELVETKDERDVKEVMFLINLYLTNVRLAENSQGREEFCRYQREADNALRRLIVYILRNYSLDNLPPLLLEVLEEKPVEK